VRFLAPLKYFRRDPRPVTFRAPPLWARAGVLEVQVALWSAQSLDLECFEARDPALVRQFFTQQEQRTVAANADAIRTVNRIWCLKETALKAPRTGLRIDTRDIDVGPDLPPEPGRPEGWPGAGALAKLRLEPPSSRKDCGTCLGD
jgi:hypothetical protein